MPGTKTTVIHAAGRALEMKGTIPLYLDWHYNWNADESALFSIAKDAPAGTTVLDVGANIGMMACSLGVQRPDLNIIAIEPVPDNVSCLRENIRTNGLNNIEVIHAAVSDQPGLVKLTVEGPWSSVVESGGVEVPAVTIDSFSGRNISVVKIDVEGWEPHAIAGGGALFSEARPLVLMEWNTMCLINAHHDPLSFAKALWDSFDFMECFFEEKARGAPQSAAAIIHDNLMHFKSVSDLLMRPKQGTVIPSLRKMIDPPRTW